MADPGPSPSAAPAAEPDRRRFDERAFAALHAAIAPVAAAVPEIEAVGVVVLWRYPDQASLPTALVVPAEARGLSLDGALRLGLAGCRLHALSVQLATGQVVALRDQVRQEARHANAEPEPPASAPPSPPWTPSPEPAPPGPPVDGD